MENPYDTYGDGKTSYRIKESLKNIKITSKLLKKGFFDITF
jgi:UDP-N-acetylglucosamine 2-epimerase (non-hydrolysing)/GDP/UDP-N,N'-diacetylbacillosamine 2-epimerase (hydrolysing)